MEFKSLVGKLNKVIFLTLCLFIFCIDVFFYRKNFKVPSSDSSHLGNCSPILSNRPIKLVKIKARGRYGAVWKALNRWETVAVKIFPPQVIIINKIIITILFNKI